MLKIRLARGGAKKRPYYTIVVADSRKPRNGRFIEKIGFYNPMQPKGSEERMSIDAERAKHWIGNGAQATRRVQFFLAEAGLIEKPVFNNPNKAKPGQKALERIEEKKQKEEEAKAAAEAAAAEEAAEA